MSTDHIDRAAEVLREHLSIAKETGEPDEVDCCARALDAAGLLATPEHDRQVAAHTFRWAADQMESAEPPIPGAMRHGWRAAVKTLRALADESDRIEREGVRPVQTPEEFLEALEMAYADANRDRDACPSGTRIIINRGAQAAAALIRARDAEVRADERAKALAGFTEERAWSDADGQRYFTVGYPAPDPSLHTVRRLVGPWEPTP